MMEVLVERASIELKTLIARLMELYFYDFSEFSLADVDDVGLYGYKYLDNYWTEKDRHPFVVKVDDKVAGFVLVRNIHTETEPIYSVAEFFVMRKYRKNGIGTKVAHKVFGMFAGTWEVAQTAENVPAQKFWRKVISEYTNGNYEEIQKSDWIGSVQRFVSAL